MSIMILKGIFDTIKLVIIALAIVIPIRFFIFQPFMVNGESMVPNYYPADYLIIDEVSYRLQSPERGEVIVFVPPHISSVKYIKRIIGLPGERVEISESKVYINGQLLEEPYLESILSEEWVNNNNMPEVQLKENEYFVMGDNRNYSSDSRRWGSVPQANIVGKVAFTISPASIFAKNSIKNSDTEY